MPDDKSPHTSEYYLARAVQCERLAKQTSMQVTKGIYLDLAKRWRALAAKVGGLHSILQAG